MAFTIIVGNEAVFQALCEPDNNCPIALPVPQPESAEPLPLGQAAS